MPDIRLNVAIDILPDLILQVVARDDDVFQNLYLRIRKCVLVLEGGRSALGYTSTCSKFRPVHPPRLL